MQSQVHLQECTTLLSNTLTQLKFLVDNKMLTKLNYKISVKAAKAAYISATRGTPLNAIVDTTVQADRTDDVPLKIPWPCSDMTKCIEVQQYENWWQGVDAVKEAYTKKTLFVGGWVVPDERTKGQPGGAGQSSRGYLDWCFADGRGLRCAAHMHIP